MLKYKAISVEKFWKEWHEGKHRAEAKVLVLTETPNGLIQDFAYVMNGFFDHHRQGGRFKYPIKYVIVPSTETPVLKLDFNVLDKIWITSDTHAFHVNITRGTSTWGTDGEFQLRDFDTPEEMTAQMADNFNSVIPENGILFHLGDWSFAGEQNIERFRNMLNVKEIHLITGNHDHFQERGNWDHIFTSRQKYLELEIGKHLKFCLFHFPITSWNNIRKGSFHLHGHQHWQGDNRFGNGRMMDIGVDGNNLFPYKLTDIIDLLKDRRFVAENDHHA